MDYRLFKINILFSVIHISFNDTRRRCSSYEQYKEQFQNRLVRDLVKEYPGVELYDETDVIDILSYINSENPLTRFIFVLDEWDFIFHQDFVT